MLTTKSAARGRRQKLVKINLLLGNWRWRLDWSVIVSAALWRRCAYYISHSQSVNRAIRAHKQPQLISDGRRASQWFHWRSAKPPYMMFSRIVIIWGVHVRAERVGQCYSSNGIALCYPWKGRSRLAVELGIARGRLASSQMLMTICFSLRATIQLAWAVLELRASSWRGTRLARTSSRGWRVRGSPRWCPRRQLESGWTLREAWDLRCRHRGIPRSSSPAGALLHNSRATVRRVSIQEEPRSSAPALRLRAPGAPSPSWTLTPMDKELQRLRERAAAEAAAEQAAAVAAATGSRATTGRAPVVQPDEMDLSRGEDGAGRPSRTITYYK